MLKSFSSADEARHHSGLKNYLGQQGQVISFTHNDTDTFVLVKLAKTTLLVRWYGHQTLKPNMGDDVTLKLGQQFVTSDKRIIYGLIAHKI